MGGAAVSIPIDSLTIFRICGAILWGFAFAYFLRNNRRIGDWLATQHEEVAALVGMAGNMIIAYRAIWLEVLFVSLGSYLGFMAHQCIAGVTPEAPALGGYKTVWVLEDSIAIVHDLIARLQDLLEGGDNPTQLSRTLLQALRLLALLKAARAGRYEPQT